MAPKTRKRLFDALRIAVCGAALWIVVRGVTLNDHVILKEGGQLVGVVTDEAGPIVVQQGGGRTVAVPRVDVAVDKDGEPLITYGLRSAWRMSNRYLLLLAVAIFFPVGFLQGVRLQWLLRVQGIHLGYWDCIKLSFAGNFLNFATPLGSNAGDVFKAYFVTTHTTSQKTEAATTIAIDRAIGLGTLIACVAAIATFSPSDSRLAEFRPYMVSVFVIGLAAVLAYLSPFLRKYLVPRRLLSRLPMFEHLQRIDQAVRTLVDRKATLVAAILMTVALQVTAIGAYFVVAVALALDAHAGNVLEYYAYFYTGAVVQALPGPPQGLGTVELTYRYFLAPFGSPSQIVCVAFAARVMVLVCALPGLLVTVTGSYKPSTPKVVGNTEPPSRTDPVGHKHDLAAT